MLMLTFSKKYKIFFRKNARSGIGGSEGSCHIDVLVCMPDVKLPDRWMDPRHWLREMSASLHDYTVADVKKKHNDLTWHSAMVLLLMLLSPSHTRVVINAFHHSIITYRNNSLGALNFPCVPLPVHQYAFWSLTWLDGYILHDTNYYHW